MLGVMVNFDGVWGFYNLASWSSKGQYVPTMLFKF